MEKASKEYTRWCSQKLPTDLLAELSEIQGNEKEIYDRFCKNLSFGTSGMRGRMGAGTNRINSVTLRRASIGIAHYLCESYERPTLVIAYDTRINSEEYAKGVAEVFVSQGVCVCLFDEPTPVPVLSFAVRDMSLCGGVMITASHNTKEYNGYKVYDECGNQLDDKKTVLMEKYIAEVDCFAKSHETERRAAAKKCAGVLPVPQDIRERYLRAVEDNTARPFFECEGEAEALRAALSELRICYTALNGAGGTYVIEALERLGMRRGNIVEVESQKAADGNFETCPSPNPEYEETFAEALKVCAQTADKPKLILATDPDSDRLGVMCLSDCGEGSEYIKLSGDELGELLTDYVCSCECGKGTKPKVAFKSYVSSPLAEDIAASYGVQMRNVFTGFKNIAAGMQRINESGDEEFIFGFEESLGYLCGDYTRDKDGIMAARLVCILAAQLATAGRTLCDRLEEIYRSYGYRKAVPFSLEYGSERQRRKADDIMTALFAGKLKDRAAGSTKICKESCYRQQNMYCAELSGGHRLIIRPSGTEPKLKAYIFASGEDRADAAENAEAIKLWVKLFLTEYMKA